MKRTGTEEVFLYPFALEKIEYVVVWDCIYVAFRAFGEVSSLHCLAEGNDTVRVFAMTDTIILLNMENEHLSIA